MTGRMRVAAACVAAVIGAAGIGVPVATPASADPISSCTTAKGVLVAVDFRHFGASITRGCDATITTGYEALHAAGFTTDGTRADGDGFVCRIDGKPTPAQDACVKTPPATAYWSYWHANPGQSGWTYSQLGAKSYHPVPGSIDAWVFGSTDTSGSNGGPTFTPAQVRAGSTASGRGSGGGNGGGGGGTHPAHRGTHHSKPTRAADPGRANRSGAPPAARPAGASTSSAAHRSTVDRAPPSTRSAAGAHPGSGTRSGSSAAPDIVDAAPASASHRTSSGSALPVVIGLLLALLLGGGAGWTALRRRRAADEL